MSKDYYTILGVPKNSSKDDIKKAFHKLAHKYHPDKSGGDDLKFKEISEAYGVLSNEKKRAEYDAYGRVFSEGAGGQGGPGFEGFDFSDMAGGQFADFDLGDIFGEFGNIFGGRGRAARGRDISVDLEIPFRESIFGTSRSLLITKTSACSACGGSGAKEKTSFSTCTACNGKGKVHETRRSLLGTFTSVRTCSSCHGAGKTPDQKCSSCNGEGTVRGENDIRVDIPAGISDGEVIRLGGMGEAVPGGAAGDLYIRIHVQPDPRFRRQGTNLITTLNIKLSDALLGGEYSVPTLEGPITVKVPAGISFGEILRVRGKGVPQGKNSRGDLLITLEITLPNKLSRKVKKLIEELRGEGI